MDEYYQVVQSLPSWLARPLLDMPSALAPDVQELRLRVGCAPAFTMRGAVCTPQETARELASLQRMLLTPQQMEEILFTLCGGRFLQNPEQGVVLQELTSVNLRVAREKTIPLPQELCAAMQTHFIGMLLVGEPGSGKTTLLRSMARELVCQKKLVSVIDERRELFSGSSRRKSPGEALDVISGIPKGQAVQMALRTLSPQILLLDELGGLDEVTALEQGLFSGVDFIATLHAASPEEAVGRPQVQALQARGALHVLVWLKGRAEPGQVREVRFL